MNEITTLPRQGTVFFAPQVTLYVNEKGGLFTASLLGTFRRPLWSTFPVGSQQGFDSDIFAPFNSRPFNLRHPLLLKDFAPFDFQPL